MAKFQILRIVVPGAFLLGSGQAAFAVICLPIPHFRYVGDTATDSNCTDNDIQTAINNVVCPGTTVVITKEHTYTGQALTINNKSLTLAGVGDGVACGGSIGACDPSVGCGGGGGGAPPAPAVTLHGDGSTSVIFIYGSSNVTLQSIELTGGGGLQGGGVLFGGAGALALVDTSIVNNSAGQGGGIYFTGLGGNATLTLNAGTIIEENTANADGGGIFLGNSTRLLALQPYTFIGFNHAPNGNGGGIAMEGTPPVAADIGSPGYNGSPAIQFNDAAKGGGIAVIAPATASAPGTAYDLEVNLFTTDGNHPGGLFSNSATQAGGAIYLKSNYDSTAKKYVNSDFCASSFNIDGNVAPEGSAIYSDLDESAGTVFYGNAVSLNPSYGCSDYDNGVNPASLGAATCSGISCNTLNGNGSLDSSNQPTGGAVIYADRGTYFDAYRFIMRFNQGGHAMHFFGIEPGNIINCLLADNTESGELIYADNAQTNIDSCTIANNSLGGPTVIYNTGSQDFYNTFQDSIIDEPGVVTLNAGSKIDVAYLLSNDLSSLGPYGDNTQGTPIFVNAAGGDYHLQLNSPGIDYSVSDSYPAYGTPATDLDGKPRTFDIPTIANYVGPRDLGAYERSPACYSADTVFCDGFEPVIY